MASVQQLEKLIHIQKMFAMEDSLEAAVTMERLQNLITKTEQILKQRTFFREERRLLRMSTAKVERYIAALDVVRKPAWVNSSMIDNNADDTKRVMINIGGLMFETTVSVLIKEENSLLAQLCGPCPPVESDHEGFFYFDRDWWLFRYVLMFLRDGQLPSDHRLLAKLAIEEEKLNLRREKNADPETKWWTAAPSWWHLEPPPSTPPPPPEDWWTDVVYKGRSFKSEDMPALHEVQFRDPHYLPTGYKDPLYPLPAGEAYFSAAPDSWGGLGVAKQHEKEFLAAKAEHQKRFTESRSARELATTGDNLFPLEEPPPVRSIRYGNPDSLRAGPDESYARHAIPTGTRRGPSSPSRAFQEEMERRRYADMHFTYAERHSPRRTSMSKELSELELSSEAARELGYKEGLRIQAGLRGYRSVDYAHPSRGSLPSGSLRHGDYDYMNGGSRGAGRWSADREMHAARTSADFLEATKDLGFYRAGEARDVADDLLGLRVGHGTEGAGGESARKRENDLQEESRTLRIKAANGDAGSGEWKDFGMN